MHPFALNRKLLVICLTIFGIMSLSTVTQAAEATSETAMPKETRNTLGRWEFRAAPIQLLARFYSVEIGYRLSKHWSTGPAATAYDSPGNLGGMFAPVIHGAAFGWGATCYLKSVATNTAYILPPRRGNGTSFGLC